MHRFLASLEVIFLAAGLPGSFRAVQADTPTPSPATPASPRAFTADDRACGAFAEEQLASDLGFSQEGIVLLAGCRRTSSGEWFVPIGPDDPRLPNGPPFSREEETATTTLRQTLAAQRIAFGVILLQTSYYGPSFAETLNDMKPKLRPPFRALQNRNLYRSLQRHSEQIVISAIADPDNLALQEYVTW